MDEKQSVPAVQAVLETTLYVEDVERSAEFYRRVFGFEALDGGRNVRPLSVGRRQVLLLCRKGGAARPRRLAGGVVPPHDGTGHLHLAFSIRASDVKRWERWLQEQEVPIESSVQWERGGRSLYFRDPDDHVLELVTPGTWAIY